MFVQAAKQINGLYSWREKNIYIYIYLQEIEDTRCQLSSFSSWSLDTNLQQIPCRPTVIPYGNGCNGMVAY